LHDKIRDLVLNQGKTDAEIAGICEMTIKDVCLIRKDILKINNYGRKRPCPKCGKSLPINLFRIRKPGAEPEKEPDESDDWCLLCRRKAGKDPYQRKKRKMVRKTESFGTVLTLCLRCEKSFESKIRSADGRLYDRVCPTCQMVNQFMETGSIDEALL